MSRRGSIICRHFRFEALERVRDFSRLKWRCRTILMSRMNLSRRSGTAAFTWVLVQEHSVERPENRPGPEKKHMPHPSDCTNAKEETAPTVAIIKTQGSDTKLVAQMQPYYEAKGLPRQRLAGYEVPPIVTQIADGENGGVMMNEFPPKYLEVVRESSGSETPLMNISEYLEHLTALGITEKDLPSLQPIMQKRIWDVMKPGEGSEKLEKTIEKLKKEDGRFHMEGGSWTNNVSWVRGYES